MKELSEIVSSTLGLLVGGVIAASLLGGVLNVMRLFFAERCDAKFSQSLRVVNTDKEAGPQNPNKPTVNKGS